MTDYAQYLEGFTIISIVVLFFVVVKIKKGLKAEIVDPDIERLEQMITDLRSDVNKELARVKEDGQKMSEKLDKKFDELNVKLDKNSQAVSNMQGMITAIFNGLRSQYDR